MDHSPHADAHAVGNPAAAAQAAGPSARDRGVAELLSMAADLVIAAGELLAAPAQPEPQAKPCCCRCTQCCARRTTEGPRL